MLAPVESAVDFGGFVEWLDLAPQYATSHVLCVPSRYDGWGMVVPEGLAWGLPVIATDRMGAALEFVETGRNGWLIPAGDGRALVDAMREAAGLSATELKQLGRHARESVSAHTLENGAVRFAHCAREAVAGWTGF